MIISEHSIRLLLKNLAHLDNAIILISEMLLVTSKFWADYTDLFNVNAHFLHNDTA